MLCPEYWRGKPFPREDPLREPEPCGQLRSRSRASKTAAPSGAYGRSSFGPSRSDHPGVMTSFEGAEPSTTASPLWESLLRRLIGLRLAAELAGERRDGLRNGR